MAIWLTILGMALAMYAARHTDAGAAWRARALAAALARLCADSNVHGADSAAAFTWAGAAGGAFAARRTGNVLLTIGAGMATFWLLRWAGM
jgi:branched-subunit amino acid transport protein